VVAKHARRGAIRGALFKLTTLRNLDTISTHYSALVALFASTANRDGEIMFLEFLIEAFDASVVGRLS
jgi:hypothetical protein